MQSNETAAQVTDEAFLLRYSRQILLPDFGIEGQERLRDARVLLIGLGGLGSPIALYLAAAGVGTLILADQDEVDLSNLQRQVLHDQGQVGRSKVDSAIERLHALNHDTRLIPARGHLAFDALRDLAAEVDLIIDASDNFPTRFAANRASLAAGVPLVSGAAIRAEGQLTAFPGKPGGPCYQCLYPPEASEPDGGCAANGILAPVVGIIGSLQACEAVKILAGVGTPLFGRLLLFDARQMQWRELRLGSDPQCPACAARSNSGDPSP